MLNFKFIIDVHLDNPLNEHEYLANKWNVNLQYLDRNTHIKPKIEIQKEYISFIFQDYQIDLSSQIVLRNKYVNRVRNEIEDTGFRIFRTWFGYECNGIPPIMLHSQDIVLKFQLGDVLKDLYKFIKCDKLYIGDLFNISGGLLGLMYLDFIDVLDFSDTSNEQQNKALKIIKKNLMNDSDILECQEELIANGLKEYAKL